MKLADLLVDRFEIQRPIGSGCTGQVYRARDLVSGDVVAVKLLADGRDPRATGLAQDLEQLVELSHPGIVRYVTHGETLSGKPFLVTEWLDGEDLKARLARAPLTMRESVELATRVAQALGAAHARGIIHRDIKPSNLFLPDGRAEQVKVLDFGLAPREGRTPLTLTGMKIGTPAYMAPEQARSGGVIDARVDVFALGCVLFQCLTGMVAFDGEGTGAVLAKILFGAVPRVRALWPAVPEDLDALVARMMSKDPALRPGDGAHLTAALAALGPLTASAAAMPIARAVKPPALTRSERRLLSVVLIGPAEGAEPAQTDEALRRAIRPFGGRIEQLADGSTIVVLEGDHQTATDQAAKAARCAIAMRALASDRPMAIAMGRAESTSKLPEGAVIDGASRLLARATRPTGDPPAIALDELSAGLLDARFDVVERDGAPVLCGEHALMQGARTLLGRPTSCVGRDWERNALAAIFEECIDERKTRVAVVIAAAGMGKSRLGAELVRRVQQRGDRTAIWVGRGDSLRAGSTLNLLAQALRGALGIHGGEPLAERRDRVRARVAEHVPAGDRQRVIEFLGELVGAPFPDDGEDGTQLRAARQDVQLMSEQMRRAWMDFLRAEASAHPVLLVLEDLQWGDFGTVRFIDTALRERDELPWMVLALARPEIHEVFPRLWAGRQSVQEIRLKELGRKASERLVRQVLGDTLDPETLERLVTQAHGNAFYLEELIRAVAEGKDGALPETVLAMVETRLARLPIEARRVLRAASVFGEVCWESGLASLLAEGMGGTTVGTWLVKLVEQEVLVVRPERAFPEERALAFRHALLREGAYAMLTEDDKRLGHRLAGEWLEQHGEDPMALAGHFERGGAGEQAARYYLRAAEQAFHVLDLDATVARCGLGLGCAPPQELRIALLGVRCAASSQGLHRIGVAMADAEELMRAAPRGSIPWAQGVVAYMEGTLVAGRFGELMAAIGLLREADPAPDAVGRMALAYLMAIWILDSFGQVPEGNALEERFAAVVRSTADREPLARFWWNIQVGVRAAYAHDDPWSGLAHSDAIHAIHGAIGGEQIYLSLQLFRGLNLWYLGALAPAQEALAGIAAADEALGVASSMRRFGLSWLLADRGALDEARALATELAEYGRAHHNPFEEGRGRWVLAEVLRRAGDLEAADRELEVAFAMLVPLEQTAALGTRAALRLAQGRPEEAVAAGEEAVARCAAMGGCGMFRGAFVHLARAEALHATGAHDAARTAIADARARLLAMADRIPDPDPRQRFLEGVPENARTLALARAWLGEAAPGA